MGARGRSWSGPAAATAASIAAHVAAVLALAAHQPSLDFAPQRAVNVQLVPMSPTPPTPPTPPRQPKPQPSAPPPTKSPDRPAATKAAPPTSAAARGEGTTPTLSVPEAAASVVEPAFVRQAATATPEAPRQDPMEAYRRKVWARLAARPPAARAGSGVARVAFGLDRTGAVRFVRLVRSSGRPDFDRACLASVRAAAPFPAAPAGAAPEALDFEVPIRVGQS